MPLDMPAIRYREDLDRLLPLAEGQDGYFLAAQAREQGIDPVVLSRLFKAGHVERTLWGVYRLARWPAPAHSELWAIALWASGKNMSFAFSHRTALRLHDVSDINPTRIDVTLPRNARIRGEIPRALVLHYRDVSEQDIEKIDGLPVTKLYRTLLDLLVDNIARDAIGQVLEGDRLSKEQKEKLRPFYNFSPDVRAYLLENTPHLRKGK